MSATSGRILIEILSKSREQKARGTKKVERNDLKNTKRTSCTAHARVLREARSECFKNTQEATSGISRLGGARHLRLNGEQTDSSSVARQEIRE